MARVSRITDRTLRKTQIASERGFDRSVGGSERSYREHTLLDESQCCVTLLHDGPTESRGSLALGARE